MRRSIEPVGVRRGHEGGAAFLADPWPAGSSTVAWKRTRPDEPRPRRRLRRELGDGVPAERSPEGVVALHRLAVPRRPARRERLGRRDLDDAAVLRRRGEEGHGVAIGLRSRAARARDGGRPAHRPRSEAIDQAVLLHEVGRPRAHHHHRACPAAVGLAHGHRIADAPVDQRVQPHADDPPVEEGQGARRLEGREHVVRPGREIAGVPRRRARRHERVLHAGRGGRMAVEGVFAGDGVPEPIEVERVPAAHEAPGVDELRLRHLVEEAASSAAVLTRQEREHVRGAHRDA